MYFDAAHLDRSMVLSTRDYVVVAKPRFWAHCQRPIEFAGKCFLQRQHDLRLVLNPVVPTFKAIACMRCDCLYTSSSRSDTGYSRRSCSALPCATFSLSAGLTGSCSRNARP